MNYLSNFHPEFTQPLLLSFKMLDKFDLIFFGDDVPFLKKYWKFLYLVPLTAAYIICMSIYMISIFNEQIDVTEFAYMVPVYIIVVDVVIEIIIIFFKRKDISTLVNDLGKIWRTFNLSSKQIKRKEQLMKKLNLFLKIFYYGSIGTLLLHLMAPLANVLVRKFVLKVECELALPFKSVYPYDPSEDWIKYLATYAFQSYTMFFLAYVHIGSEYLMITLCAFLAINFALLSEDLINVPPHLNKGNLLNQYSLNQQLERQSANITIQEFVKRHQKLIRLSDQLDDIFNRIVFVMLLFITIIVCFLGFATTVSHGVFEKLNNLIGVLALLFPTYIFCYYSALLTSEISLSCKYRLLAKRGRKYLHSSSDGNWMLWFMNAYLYHRLKINMVAQLGFSQKPCCLTSIKHVPVNLNTFTKVLSTTWSYFSLATTMYSESK